MGGAIKEYRTHKHQRKKCLFTAKRFLTNRVIDVPLGHKIKELCDGHSKNTADKFHGV
jgi:hypothetical protein